MADIKISSDNRYGELSVEQSSNGSGKTVTELDEMCEPCQNKNKTSKAKFFCRDCTEYHCLDCSSVHKLFSFTKSHKIVGANESIGVKKLDLKGLDQCQEHQELLNYFCEDDEKLCCSECIIASHLKCHCVADIKDKASRHFFATDILQCALEEIDETINTVVNQLTASKNELIKDNLEVSKKIQRVQDDVNSMFDDLKRTVANQLQTFKHHTFDRFDTKENRLHGYIANVKYALSQLHDARQQGTPTQQFILIQHLSHLVTELKQNTEREQETIEEAVVNFEFDDSLILPPANKVVPGKLITKYLSKSDQLPRHALTNTVSLNMVASINVKQSQDENKDPFYRGLDFFPDGRLVALDNANRKCVLFNQRLEKIGEHIFSEIIPLCVAVLSNSELVVSTGQSCNLTFLYLSESNEFSVLRTLNVKYVYDYIISMDDNYILAGTYDDTQPVRVVSVRGEEREFGFKFPLKKFPIHYGACAFMERQNKVVITLRQENVVYIYDMISKSRVEVKDEKIIQEPYGVATGPTDCIFVCCMKPQSLVQITHTGQILKSHQLNMWHPCFLCCTKDNTKFAVVGCADRFNQIKIFNITYK